MLLVLMPVIIDEYMQVSLVVTERTEYEGFVEEVYGIIVSSTTIAGVLTGIGISIIAASAVSLMYIIFVYDDGKDAYIDWKLTNIYDSTDALKKALKSATREVDIITPGDDLCNNIPKSVGLSVRIIGTGDITNHYNLSSIIDNLNKGISQTNRNKSQAKRINFIECKYTNAISLTSYFRVDKKLFVLVDKVEASGHTVIEFEESGVAWRAFYDHFDGLWADSMSVVEVPAEVTRKTFIDKILEDCAIATSRLNVRGIIAKYDYDERQRITRYTYGQRNYTGERPNRTLDEDDVVTLMNREEKTILYDFRDNFYYAIKNEEGDIEKKNGVVHDANGIARILGGKKEDMELLLAAPVVNQQKNGIIGCVTFEYLEVPKELNAIDVSNNASQIAIAKMLRLAEICASVVSLWYIDKDPEYISLKIDANDKDNEVGKPKEEEQIK